MLERGTGLGAEEDRVTVSSNASETKTPWRPAKLPRVAPKSLDMARQLALELPDLERKYDSRVRRGFQTLGEIAHKENSSFQMKHCATQAMGCIVERGPKSFAP